MVLVPVATGILKRVWGVSARVHERSAITKEEAITKTLLAREEMATCDLLV